MGRSATQSTKAIRSLLDEKRRIEQWLERLDTAAETTPDAVRAKVRRDYSERLKGILAELEGYREDVQQALERQRELQRGLMQQEREASERLSEAELRHTVGEYDEAEWTTARSEIVESLTKLRKEREAAEEELAGLEAVVASFAAPAAADQAAGDEPEEAEAEETAGEAAGGEAEVATASARADPGQAKPPRAQTDAFDELAFLKSVTEDEEHGPRPERASGAAKAVSDEEVARSQLPPTEPAQPAAKPPRKKPLALGAAGIRAVQPVVEPPSKGTAKTLKCADCGTMNLPTEWYCEKCGAEISAV